jgi:hypothetical protein
MFPSQTPSLTSILKLEVVSSWVCLEVDHEVFEEHMEKKD